MFASSFSGGLGDIGRRAVHRLRDVFDIPVAGGHKGRLPFMASGLRWETACGASPRTPWTTSARRSKRRCKWRDLRLTDRRRRRCLTDARGGRSPAIRGSSASRWRSKPGSPRRSADRGCERLPLSSIPGRCRLCRRRKTRRNWTSPARHLRRRRTPCRMACSTFPFEGNAPWSPVRFRGSRD